MTLAAGTVLGNYVIRERLGSGAMGDVYRAQDRRLGRDVALKFLGMSLARNPDALQRFEREARVLASLDHPNIARIYGLEEADGSPFLVLELVPGDTLADRLRRGPLPVFEALTVSRQIALALEAAHAKGVVHRDLKPANVKLRPDGRVSVLDFGLAKVLGGAVDSSAPPGSLEATVPGLVLGTPAYMSPEQARGQRVDERADLWGFGVVLFECVCGVRPFGGDTPVEVLAGILERPPRWELLPASTPPRIRALLERCLEKDPARRIRKAGELRQILESTESHPVSEGPWFKRMTRFLGGDRQGQKPRREEPEPRPMQIHLVQETFDEAIETSPAWSPDGSRLAFCREVGGARKVFVKTVGKDDARPVTRGEHDDIQPAWFGSNQLLFVRSKRQSRRLDPGDIFGAYIDADVWRVNLETSEEARFIENAFNPAPSPDGQSIAIDASWAGPRRIWLVDTHGRNPAQITSDTSEAVLHLRPRWSPDSGKIVFQNVERTQFNVRVVDVASRRLFWITEDVVLNVEPSWSPNGGFVYFSSYRGGGINTWRMPVDAEGKPRGALGQVTSGAGQDLEPAPAPDGARMAFTTMSQNADLWRLPVSPDTGHVTGEPEKVVASSREDSRGAWSPDGRFIAFNSDRAGAMNIWIHDLGTKSSRRLTEGSGGDYQPSWSPDGRRLVFFSSREGRPGLYLVEVDSGEMTSLSSGDAIDVNPFFSPDGRHIAFQSDRDGRLEVWVMDASGHGARQLTRQGVMGHFLRWTPDGMHIVFRSASSEKPGLWRVAMDGGEPEPLPKVMGGSHLSLSPDATRIMDVVEHRTLWVSPLDGTPPERVFEFPDPDVRIDYPVWSPDGSYVLFDRLRPQGGNIWILEGLTS
jgi:eukaryotic-like serine/threonine-protein kinase